MNHFILTLTAILEEKLKESIKLEIHLLREFLGNLLQEEIILQNQDRASWNKLMQDRFGLIQQIKHIRHHRNSEENQIREASCETLLLIDQLHALLIKIHSQITYNENIAIKPQHLIAIDQFMPYSKSSPLTVNKKNTLMTLP